MPEGAVAGPRAAPVELDVRIDCGGGGLGRRSCCGRRRRSAMVGADARTPTERPTRSGSLPNDAHIPGAASSFGAGHRKIFDRVHRGHRRRHGSSCGPGRHARSERRVGWRWQRRGRARTGGRMLLHFRGPQRCALGALFRLRQRQRERLRQRPRYWHVRQHCRDCRRRGQQASVGGPSPQGGPAPVRHFGSRAHRGRLGARNSAEPCFRAQVPSRGPRWQPVRRPQVRVAQ
mmetsp:Transcript_104582/g.294706  ORF Transcript_104582/g.294706 Transcript_104582/m.294706 type:complete len:232 (+) Transcript_104582:365-1060(+)